MEESQKGLSAGRVQSVALYLIIQRENEIKNFKPEEYWTIDADFKKGKEEFKASFYGENGKKVSLKNNDDVRAVLSKIDKKKDFDITKVTKRTSAATTATIYDLDHATGC